MGKTTMGNGADELVLQLKTQLSVVVEVLCVLYDFIDMSFGSKFQEFCETNSDLQDKLEVLKSLKSKRSGAGSDSSSNWDNNKKGDTTEAEIEEITFSVPVVMEDDSFSTHNYAAKCEVVIKADEDDPLDFLGDELNIINPDPLAINACDKPSYNNHNAQPKPHPGPSSKNAGLFVIRQPPKVGVPSSSSSIFINEDNKEENDDRGLHSKSTKSSSESESKSGGQYYKCNKCFTTYMSEWSLKMHCQNKHYGPQMTCPVCGITVVDKFRLERHVQTHIEGEVFPCQHCGRNFSRKDHQRQHLKTCVKNPKVIQTILIDDD